MRSEFISYELKSKVNLDCCHSCANCTSDGVVNCSDIPLLTGYRLRSCPKFVQQKISENE